MSYNSYALKKILTKEHAILILEKLGAHGINPRDINGIRSSCPIHKSKGNTVFVYNDVKHLYNCYGECEYDEKDGDIIKLVQVVEKCNYDSAIEYICDIAGIDKKIIQSSEEWLLEETKVKLDTILMEAYPPKDEEMQSEYEYGVPPMDESILTKYLGKTDDLGFIDSLGFSAPILTLFESGYETQDKRWLLPIRSPDGLLLGFDGRDVTNEKKSKWKKRAGLLTHKLLGRLDIVKPFILEKDEIIIVEGKKDQMAIYELGLQNVSCTYGSNLSKEQKELIDGLCSRIVIFPDADAAGYKHVKSIVELCYPEYEILVTETPDGEDPATLGKKFALELYENAIYVEEWLKKYEYRDKKPKKNKKNRT